MRTSGKWRVCASLAAVVLAWCSVAVAADQTAASDGQTPPCNQSGPVLRKSHFMSAPPGVAFYPVHVAGPYAPFAPLTPVPAFDWGHFGARSHPIGFTHSGYYRDVTQWTFPRTF